MNSLPVGDVEPGRAAAGRRQHGQPARQPGREGALHPLHADEVADAVGHVGEVRPVVLGHRAVAAHHHLVRPVVLHPGRAGHPWRRTQRLRRGVEVVHAVPHHLRLGARRPHLRRGLLVGDRHDRPAVLADPAARRTGRAEPLDQPRARTGRVRVRGGGGGERDGVGRAGLTRHGVRDHRAAQQESADSRQPCHSPDHPSSCVPHAWLQNLDSAVRAPRGPPRAERPSSIRLRGPPCSPRAGPGSPQPPVRTEGLGTDRPSAAAVRPSPHTDAGST